jgi:hypothetical protein
MRDSEVRGLILEALYNQRRKDLVNLDDEVGGPPLCDQLRNDRICLNTRRVDHAGVELRARREVSSAALLSHIPAGARVHGGFGAFIPVGIRIGLEAWHKRARAR